MKTAFINRLAILSTRRTIYTTSTTAIIRSSSIIPTQHYTTTKQYKMSTAINHADASNLTSDQDWATLNSDGSLPSNFPTSNGDTTIAKMGTPIHTSCCPSGTVEFLSEKKEESASEGCCDAVTATLLAMQKKMSTHAPKVLIHAVVRLPLKLDGY